jgi:hypothetical protein
MVTEEKTEGRKPALYCGDFPVELKERCESIAGALRMSISKFVEEILEDETRELKGSYETIMQWYAARLQARAEADGRDAGKLAGVDQKPKTVRKSSAPARQR